MILFEQRRSLAINVGFFRSKRAFSLVSVLLLTGFLSAIVLMIVLSIRPSLEAARVYQDSVLARLTADAAINRIIVALESKDDPLQLSGSVLNRIEKRITFNQAIIDISIEPEGGKLDINYAPLDHVEAVLIRAGIEDTAVQFAISRLNEARRNNILLFRVSELLPEQARFSSSVATLKRFFTTLTGTGSFNPKAADALIIETIPNMTAAERDALLRFKDGAEEATVRGLLLPHAGRFTSPLSTYRITATAKLKTGSVARREAGVLLHRFGLSAAVVSLDVP